MLVFGSVQLRTDGLRAPIWEAENVEGCMKICRRIYDDGLHVLMGKFIVGLIISMPSNFRI